MKISHLADRARCLVLAAGLALVASFAGNAALAETAKAPAANAMADAPTIIATAKVNCDLANASVIGGTDIEADGKKIKGTLYEIACKSGPGFIATAVTPTDVRQVFTCTLVAGVKEKQPNAPTCALAENTPNYKWLTPVVQKYASNCVVSNARVMGSTPADSTDPKVDRYEFACGTSAGGVLDYPQLGSDAPVDYKSCLMVADSKLPCTLSTAEQAAAALKPVAAQADADCQVNNTRFVGITKESDGYYYEFGCSNKPGFIVLTGNDNSFTRVVPCASAAGLGGCKFTDAGAAAADANGTYTQQLKAGGFTCTVKDYNVVGTQEQTKRDYIEFKCPEQPFGLIGFVPQPGSQSSLRLNDCFHDQVGQKACTYVTTDMLMAQVDKLIKAAEPTKACDVTQVRYIGESASVDDGVIAEIACANKRGYIVAINADRQGFADKALPCVIARTHKDADQQCTIPGNGTYTSGD